MKIMITFLSALIIFTGLMPLLGEEFFIPTAGIGYSIVLIILGAIILFAGAINTLLIGLEKFFLILQGILLVLVGLIKFFPAILPFLPNEGPLYAGTIIIIGGVGLAYGILGMG